MKILNYPSAAAESVVARIVSRGLSFSKKDHAAVSRILADVRRRGDQALVEYSRRFDAPGFTLRDLRVGPVEFRQAAAAADRGFTRALNRAATQIEAFHRRQVRSSFISLDRAGTMLGQLVRPVERVGVYVPGGQGGKTPLVSSVLMGAIPARVAGVAQVVMVTPPTADGRVNPHLLVAARKAGVDEVYKAGSAWAVAALAYGTETIPRVDVIVGPGNRYVTLAKKIVAGTVGIDILAGPSEILIIADESADPEFIAADLLSQAEHDPMASAVLVTARRELAQAVQAALGRQLAQLARAEIARESIRRFGAADRGAGRGRGHRARQPHGARASRAAAARSLCPPGRDPQRRRRLPRGVHPRAGRGLRGGAQPRAADRRDSSFRLGPFGRQLRQAHQPDPLLRRRLAPRSRGHPAAGGSRGPGRPRQFDPGPIESFFRQTTAFRE